MLRRRKRVTEVTLLPLVKVMLLPHVKVTLLPLVTWVDKSEQNV